MSVCRKKVLPGRLDECLLAVLTIGLLTVYINLLRMKFNEDIKCAE
jgi:hypothetical protein